MAFPYRAVTFDCFGTLIDWRRGQERVLRQLPSLRGCEDRLDALADAREQAEQELQAGPWLPYAEILARSLATACQRLLDVEPTARECTAFATGQLGWPAWPDAPAALQALCAEVPVGLLSNCDDDVLRASVRKHLGAPVQHYVSATTVRAYKPAPDHWRHFLELTGMQPGEVLHVSFTRRYDLDPAHELGFALGFLGRDDAQPPDDLPLAAVAGTLPELLDALR